ncbi:Rho GTPase activation protein [Cokeromyces recurvatus]|uniref:Rho GTPase activation protein n=1 Tax=Cokeromyces recurvatus TaxID=90255 RepID=UPI00221F2A21|nr:Rho GTPase activation protein [Cokeromyces recurvatus]KAI7900972.1 Rho GTPase activation protein [Cokeromyces recurvatus]
MIYDDTEINKKQQNSLLTFLLNSKKHLFGSYHNKRGSSNSSAFITKGIFGAPLKSASLCGSTSKDGLTVPEPVYRCFEEIMKRGLLIEGIFRLSGAAPEIDKLSLDFDKPPTYGKYLDLKNNDIHAITGVVKRYLRQLPEPVIPTSFHDNFIQLYDEATKKIITSSSIINLFATLIQQLPIEHFHLIHYIILLSSKIQLHSNINMMNPEALAVVLAPVCTGLLETETISVTNKKRLISIFMEANTKWTRIWTLLIEHSHDLLEHWKPTLMWQVVLGHHTVPCHHYTSTTTTTTTTTTTITHDINQSSLNNSSFENQQQETFLDIAPPLFSSSAAKRKSTTHISDKYKVIVMRSKQKSMSYNTKSSMVVQR